MHESTVDHVVVLVIVQYSIYVPGLYVLYMYTSLSGDRKREYRSLALGLSVYTSAHYTNYNVV